MSKTAEKKPGPKGKPKVDPMDVMSLKGLALRIGPFVLGGWIIAILIGKAWAYIAVGVVTLAAAGLVGWALSFAKKSRAVAGLVQSADTPEARKEALSKLETDYKKGDTAAAFARAQLLLHEDPKKALAVLEEINLEKVMAPIADEARAQRAMIHLLLGETDRARALVDGIDLSRHQQAKTRATLITVIGEAWARTGQPKKAIETLEVLDPEDAEYADLKPQIYRSLAFAYAGVNDTRKMKGAVHKLVQMNPQLLAGFLAKKVHPLLAQEAKQALMRSGGVPRKMMVKRM